jgi:large subunit ribosomal protein L9
MKLLLTKSVPQLGIVGDVVNVSSGYARNYLIPRRLATEPTDANMRRLAEARKQAELELAKERARMEEMIQRLEGVEVTVSARANEEGVLYGSVGRKEIAAALADEGHVVLPEHIALTAPIRRIDTVPVEVRFSGDLRATIKVWVVREKVEGEEAPEEQTSQVGKEAGEDDNDRSE